MYLLGHIGLAVLVYITMEKIFDEEQEWLDNRNIFLIGLGSLLPDFLDKPVGALIFGMGRWIGHTFLFQVLVLLVLLSLRSLYPQEIRFPTDIVVLFFGANLHIIGDLPSLKLATIFWPFFGEFPTGPKNGFLLGFTNHITVITETLGLIILIIVGWYKQWGQKEWSILTGVVLIYVLLFTVVYWFLVMT